jgi:hypothetical protein
MGKKTSITRNRVRVTAFYGEVRGARYRAVLVKQSGENLYVWSWLDAQGTLIFIDLLDRTKRLFRDVVGGHRSIHADGRAHTRVEMKAGSNYAKETLRKIDDSRDFEITVPLDSVPPEAPAHAPWREVDCEIVLRSKDFAGAAGVNLIFSLSTSMTAVAPDSLGRYWNLDGDRPIVIRAEPIAYPGPA